MIYILRFYRVKCGWCTLMVWICYQFVLQSDYVFTINDWSICNQRFLGKFEKFIKDHLKNVDPFASFSYNTKAP